MGDDGTARVSRRAFLLAALGAGAAALAARQSASADSPGRFDIPALKRGWQARLRRVAATRHVPLIDIESSYNPGDFDPRDYARRMDQLGVAMLALSPQIGEGGFAQGRLWHDGIAKLVQTDPERYIPATTAGVYPAWTEKPKEFLDEHFKRAVADGYPLLGEFEFRHYPSPRQVKRHETYREVNLPLNGEPGHRLFRFSEETGLSFQIHYEIEDALLPALEEMLAAYPRARVVWCHLAQIRYQERSAVYGPAYVRRLLDKHPGLFIDTAFGDASSAYPPSGQRHARVWDDRGKVRSQWVELINDHPWRFLAALDLGPDRMNELEKKVHTLRTFLAALAPDARRIVAHAAAWKLLFGEDVDV